MAKGNGSKGNNLIDRSGLVDRLVHELATKGSVRLVHLGLFRVTKIKDRKRYDFKARKVITMEPYKQIVFTPSIGVRELIRKGKTAATQKVGE
jgi:nucleoid DNA-binding protein